MSAKKLKLSTADKSQRKMTFFTQNTDCSDSTVPYGKAVFVRISDEYAANILPTALFTVIVRYIFTSCREYPGNKVGLTKKLSLNVCSLSYNRCIFAAKT